MSPDGWDLIDRSGLPVGCQLSLRGWLTHTAEEWIKTDNYPHSTLGLLVSICTGCLLAATPHERGICQVIKALWREQKWECFHIKSEHFRSWIAFVCSQEDRINNWYYSHRATVNTEWGNTWMSRYAQCGENPHFTCKLYCDINMYHYIAQLFENQST